MAFTASERKKMVEDLEGDWWRLDRVIPDDKDRKQFVWDVVKDGLVSEDPYFCSTLQQYFDPKFTAVAVQYLKKVPLDSETHRGVKGWNYAVEELVQQMAQQDPNGLQDACATLPAPANDFSRLFLGYHASADVIDESAQERLAQSYAATTYDEPWYELRDSIPDERWASLVIQSITSEDVVEVQWSRIKDYVGGATVEQAVQIIARDASNQVRQHAWELLGELDEAGIAVVEAFVKSLPDDGWFLTRAQQGTVAPLVVARMKFGLGLDDFTRELVRTELDAYGFDDIDITEKAFLALDEADRASLVTEVLESASYNDRVILLSHFVPTLEVLETTLKAVDSVYSAQTPIVEALARFGTMAIEPIAERMKNTKNMGDGAPETYVAALGAIGPESAEVLVQLTGARTKKTRTAAAQALGELGKSALDALKKGVDAGKKNIREACAALVEAIELAADNPLNDLEQQLAKLDDPEMEAVFEELAGSGYYAWDTSERITAFAEKHGVLPMLRARDWFLADSRTRLDVWNNVVRFYRKDPMAPWIAADAFARMTGGLYSYYVDSALSAIREIAQTAPEAVAEAFAFYLKGAPPSYRAEMLGMLVSLEEEIGKTIDADVYFTAMEDGSKVIREHGVQGLAASPDDHLARAVELLGARKKNIRLAAADLLTRIDATSVKAELKAALDKEKTADVRTLLEQALEAAGGSAFEFPGDDGSKVTDADVDAFLAGLNQAKLPGFVDLDGLSKPTFKASGDEMSNDALHGLISRLMKEGPDNEDAVARRVRPFLEDESANEFSVELKDAWAQSGGPSGDKWAIFQQAILANDDRMDEVAPHLDFMAANNNHHLAGWYLDVLHRHGSRGSRSWIAYWSKAAERSSVADRAQALLEAEASEHGMQPQAYASTLNTYIADDVADRNVPTLGLEEAIVVDYGERTFAARLDQNLNLVVADTESNKTYKSLPRTRKNETVDADAKEHLKAVKKELRRVVKEVGSRLEASMISGRPWTAEALKSLFFGHPIMSRFAGRLVFRTDDGVLFRVSDAECLGADYDVIELAADATIRLAHPLQMTGDELDLWGQHFADAEIVQPFEQLGRPTFGTDDDPFFADGTLGTSTRGGIAGRLRRLGWRRGWAEDAGIVYTASRLLAGRGVRAWLDHGGYYVGDPSWDADEAIDVESVRFEDLAGNDLRLEDIDPIAYSEIRYEVSQITE